MKISRKRLRKIISEQVINEIDMSGAMDMIKDVESEANKEFIDAYVEKMDTNNADLEDIEELRRELKGEIDKLKFDKSNLVTKDELVKLKRVLLRAMQNPNIADEDAELIRLLDMQDLS